MSKIISRVWGSKGKPSHQPMSVEMVRRGRGSGEKIGVRPVGREHEAGADLLAVAGSHADDAAALPHELAGVEALLELDAERAGPLDQEVVEVLAEQDDRGLLRSEAHLPPARGHDARGVDEVAEAADLGADAQLVEQGDAVGREARSAGLVPGELVLVEQDDVADALLREGHGRSGAAGPGADDHDGGCHGPALITHRAPRSTS